MKSSRDIKEFIGTVRPHYQAECEKHSRPANPNRLLFIQLLTEISKYTDSENHLMGIIAAAKGFISKEVHVANNRWISIPGYHYKVGSDLYTILKSGLKNKNGKKLNHFKLVHCLEQLYNWLVKNPELCKKILEDLHANFKSELQKQNLPYQPFPWNNAEEFLGSILEVITSLLQKEKETIEAKKREYPTPKVIKEKLPLVATQYRTAQKHNEWHETLSYLMDFVHLTCDIHGEPSKELLEDEESRVLSIPYQLRLGVFFYIIASIENEKMGYWLRSPNSSLLNSAREVFGVSSIKEINPQDVYKYSVSLLNNHLSGKNFDIAMKKLQQEYLSLKEIIDKTSDKTVDKEKLKKLLNEKGKMLNAIKENIGAIRTNIEDVICTYKDKQPTIATKAGRTAGNLTIFGATKTATTAGFYVAGRFMSGATAQKVLSYTIQGAICVAVGVPFGGSVVSGIAAQVGKQAAPVILPTAASLLFIYLIEPTGRHLGKTVENTIVGTCSSVNKAFKGAISFLVGNDNEVKVEIDPGIILTEEQKEELKEQAEFYESLLRLPNSLPNHILTAHDKEMLRRRLDSDVYPLNNNNSVTEELEDFVELTTSKLH